MGEVIKWDYKVTYTDLDHNGHMNNAKYLDVIYNMVTQGKFEFFTNNIVFDYEAIENGIKMLKSRKTTGKLVCDKINEDNIVV